MKKHAAPFIAVILLLLPLLYVASYYALVLPGPGPLAMTSTGECKEQSSYRLGSDYARQVFWPVEQIDRRLRPKAWELIRR
jgi:hypothetical protein